MVVLSIVRVVVIVIIIVMVLALGLVVNGSSTNHSQPISKDIPY